MTYDYNEFLNEFAGALEYKCGGKTTKKMACGKKIKKVACGKKIKSAKDGTKTNKMSKAEKKNSIEADANDTYIGNLPEKPWVPEEPIQKPNLANSKRSPLMTPNIRNSLEGYIAPSYIQIGQLWPNAPIGRAFLDPKTGMPILPKK